MKAKFLILYVLSFKFRKLVKDYKAKCKEITSLNNWLEDSDLTLDTEDFEEFFNTSWKTQCENLKVLDKELEDIGKTFEKLGFSEKFIIENVGCYMLTI